MIYNWCNLINNHPIEANMQESKFDEWDDMWR
jgi:hypothetical protein